MVNIVISQVHPVYRINWEPSVKTLFSQFCIEIQEIINNLDIFEKNVYIAIWKII